MPWFLNHHISFLSLISALSPYATLRTSWSLRSLLGESSRYYLLSFLLSSLVFWSVTRYKTWYPLHMSAFTPSTPSSWIPLFWRLICIRLMIVSTRISYILFYSRLDSLWKILHGFFLTHPLPIFLFFLMVFLLKFFKRAEDFDRDAPFPLFSLFFLWMVSV